MFRDPVIIICLVLIFLPFVLMAIDAAYSSRVNRRRVQDAAPRRTVAPAAPPRRTVAPAAPPRPTPPPPPKPYKPTSLCMLGKKYAPGLNIQPFTLTEKLDGVRCIAVKANGAVAFYTRSGNVIPGLLELQAALTAHPLPSFVLDGELLDDCFGSTRAARFKHTNALIRSLQREPREACGLTFHAFDALTAAEYGKRCCNRPYRERRAFLDAQFADTPHVKPIPVLYTGVDESVIQPLFERIVAQGGEGLMLNLNHAPYEFRRSGSILKIKPEKSLECPIIGFNPGEGRFTGTLGSLIVDYMGAPVGVSAGLSDADRAHIWGNRSALLGSQIKVRYAEESHDAEGTVSLRFPVFAGFVGGDKTPAAASVTTDPIHDPSIPTFTPDEFVAYVCSLPEFHA